MPTYEYKCNVCGHRFDVRQHMGVKPIETCPECNGCVKRVLGAPAGIIKGKSQGSSKFLDIPCGKENTCCGRQAPCAKRPCDQ